jgi:Pectinacetylesterase
MRTLGALVLLTIPLAATGCAYSTSPPESDLVQPALVVDTQPLDAVARSAAQAESASRALAALPTASEDGATGQAVAGIAQSANPELVQYVGQEPYGPGTSLSALVERANRTTIDTSTSRIAVQGAAWNYVDIPGAVCANGSQTGIGVNAGSNAEELVVYFEGGGACWNLATCGIGTAANFRTGYDADDFDRDDTRNWSLFARSEQRNPFRNMNQVIVPYCTADVHAGTRSTTYSTFPSVVAEHRGGSNVAAMLPYLKASFPRLKRVVLTGTSAGGFGAQLNYGRFASALPGVRIDVLADSAQLIAPGGNLTAEWIQNWGVEIPTDCVGCGAEFPRYVDYLMVRNPTAKFGVLASFYDVVLTPFFNFGLDFWTFRNRTSELLSQRYATHPNGTYLARSSFRHGYLSGVRDMNDRTNRDTFDWVTRFVNGTAPRTRQ